MAPWFPNHNSGVAEVDWSLVQGVFDCQGSALDSASGRMVLNLFIEGEEEDDEIIDIQPGPSVRTRRLSVEAPAISQRNILGQKNKNGP